VPGEKFHSGGLHPSASHISDCKFQSHLDPADQLMEVLDKNFGKQSLQNSRQLNEPSFEKMKEDL